MAMRTAMMMLLACTTGLSLTAQAVVSPAGYATRVGNMRDIGPFRRFRQATWQQIHTDLKGKARILTQIGFRQGDKNDGSPRTVDVDLLIGDSDFAKAGNFLPTNFIGQPFVAMSRRKIALPGFKGPPPGGFPAPFTILFKFDAPWMYSGKNDLCYQFRVYSNTNASQYVIDFAIVRNYEEGTGTTLGQGCTATGQSLPMTLSGAIRSFYHPAQHTFRWSVVRGPALARSTFLIGSASRARLIPKLCTLLQVDGVFLGINTFSDRNGAFATPTIAIPFDAGLVGAKLHAQAYTLDSRRHPGLLPVSATNGLRITVPARPPKPVDVATINNSDPQNRSGVRRDGWAMITEFK